MNIRSAIWDATTRIVADTIALFSPSRAAVYRRERELYKRKYFAGSTTGPYQLWSPTNRSGDAEVLTDRTRAVARVRDLERNNPMVAGLVLKRTTLIVGDEIGFKALVKDDKGQPLKTVNDAIEAAFYDYADTALADGRSLTEGLQLVQNHLTIDGEILVKSVEQDLIQVLETDYLDTSKGIYGIDFTPAGKPTNFHLYDNHPQGVVVTSLKSAPVPADQIMLLADTTRSSQRRGISRLVAAVMKLNGIDDLEDAELVAARSSAAYGLLITSDMDETQPFQPFVGTDGTTTPPKDLNGRQLEYIESGGIRRLRPGESVTSFKSERPNSNFDPFIRGRQRSGASTTGMSYETATGDYSQVNFSSARMARLIEWAVIKREQYRLRQLLNWIYKRWMPGAVVSGRVPIPPEEYNENPRRFLACSWQLAGNDGIDPLKEIETLEREIKLGVNSPQRFAAERGRDPGEVLSEIQLVEEDRKKAKMPSLFEIDATKPAPRQEAFTDGK